MQVINVDLILNKPLRFKYSDNTFVEYTIIENPFDAGSCFYLLYTRHKEKMPRKKVKPALSEPVNMQGKHF